MAMNLEKAISARKRVLQNPYAYVDEQAEIRSLKAARRTSENPYAHVDELDRTSRPIGRFDGLKIDGTASAKPSTVKLYTDDEIENLARELHLQIWERRKEIFIDHESRSPIDMLNPIVALKMIGYEVGLVDAVGLSAKANGSTKNIAGLIDKSRRQVFLTGNFPRAVRIFTAAHELGHALMHELVEMHRDKPIDGSSASRDPQEREADKFAAHFLLPKKLLSRTFESLYGKAPFQLSDDTIFALSGALPHANWRPQNLRDLTRLLSSTTRFDGQRIVPLADQFRVSREAMAIRLEQLALVA